MVQKWNWTEIAWFECKCFKNIDSISNQLEIYCYHNVDDDDDNNNNMNLWLELLPQHIMNSLDKCTRKVYCYLFSYINYAT